MIVTARGKFSCRTVLKKCLGTSFLFRCNFNPWCLPCKLPIFYKECLEAWSDFNGNQDIVATKQDVLNEIIWNNQNLLINKQSSGFPSFDTQIQLSDFIKNPPISSGGILMPL